MAGALRTSTRRTLGAGLAALVLLVAALGYGQFRGAFTATTRLTLDADRSGLVLEPGAKVTFNGVRIGRVVAVDTVPAGGATAARLAVDVAPRYAAMLPADVVADITATTVFGNKYVSLTSPENPSAQRLSPDDPIRVRSVSTEFNTLFESILAIAERVDPVRLNATLSAVAEGLTGLGARFGAALADGNAILDEVNPRLPRLRYATARLADLTEVYTAAAPDLLDALAGAATTATTLNRQRDALSAALLGAVGFGRTATETFEPAGPYLVAAARDLLPTARVFDEHSPSLFCTLRNYAQVAPRVAGALGANGYSLNSFSGGGVTGAEPPYIYPDNLPRVNAKGGPGGRPGCWQSITRELWPAPTLVMDTGASIAPYNHLELGSPLLVDHVWGRQVGEYTINP
ncbi:Mce family protein Mce2A [Mycolicibacterium chitae]|uniref:Virulence factor Mce family protein n=1 Tax=Mycolicibacterium chitae TaxID=1792 RepID=A0A448HZB0_MYCCI|nr:MCE family protein [Mycolicibacterium chitae]MCV7105549.1 MCE family protein [Mycolicibacterium chitae]BBZ02727.1 Mce family protein Mce2A [Mycolicibacterium chitae]VEG45568.1 virulence factor Mce family protein [Mycolicibacterium chitae]